MLQELFDNNYVFLEQFIPHDEAIELAEKFKTDCENANLPGDPQAENSHSIYNYKPALELLCNSTHIISEIIGEPVLPTYTYARVYKEGSVLKKHTDRPSCEISATLHLNGDKPWPIWIKNKDNKNVCLELKPGDAVLYLGCVAPHWRDEFYGTWYSQFFMHYVRSASPAGFYYFDKVAPDLIDERDIMNALHNEPREGGQFPKELTHRYLNGMLMNKEDFLAIDWDFKPEHKCENKQSEEENMPSNILNILEQKKQNIQNKKSRLLNRLVKEKEEVETNLNERVSLPEEPVFVAFDEKSEPKVEGIHTLDHFIRVYENALPDKVCDDILNEYVTTDLWTQAMTGGGADNTSRNCDVISISQREILEQSPNIRSKLDKELYNCVASLINKYESDCAREGLSISQDTGYELLRYREGQFYVQHTDHFKENPRVASCSICLNDDYGGGEFAFFDRSKVLKPKKGSVIMFPSSFMFPHEVMHVTRGNRYAIITWLV